MKRNTEESDSQVLFVGIDVHKRIYHVTGIWSDGVVAFSTGMEADKEKLVTFLSRRGIERVEAVYEAGYYGYSLHDYLIEHGAKCIVTPPSLIPITYGNRVKTDSRDSEKLALYLAKGLLKSVHVPTPEERCHRQVIRTRTQLIEDRKRKQSQIKSFLAQYGVTLITSCGKWSKAYVYKLKNIRIGDKWSAESFRQLVTAYEFVDKQVTEQTSLLKKLAKTDKYCERVAILRSIPGIGLLTAMQMLLELQNIERFRTADKLAAYVGLTPSQFSSGDHVRMGRITRIGKPQLRAALVEAAWILIRKDKKAKESFDRICKNAGRKRAIVAIARRLLLKSRSMIINGKHFERCA